MDTCTVEVGLLKKHPCGANAVTKCANCEQPLCSKHAAPKMSAGKKVFLCPECAKAWKESEKLGDLPATPAAAPGAAAAKKPAEAPKPAAAAKPAAPAKPAAAAAKPAAAQKKPEPAEEHSGALEFTPGKPQAESKPEPAPAAKKPEPAPAGKKSELSIEDSGPLEFEPSKPPTDKK